MTGVRCGIKCTGVGLLRLGGRIVTRSNAIAFWWCGRSGSIDIDELVGLSPASLGMHRGFAQLPSMELGFTREICDPSPVPDNL